MSTQGGRVRERIEEIEEGNGNDGLLENRFFNKRADVKEELIGVARHRAKQAGRSPMYQMTNILPRREKPSGLREILGYWD